MCRQSCYSDKVKTVRKVLYVEFSDNYSSVFLLTASKVRSVTLSHGVYLRVVQRSDMLKESCQRSDITQEFHIEGIT